MRFWRCTHAGKKSCSAKGGPTKQGLGACYPRKLLNLGSWKCHVQPFPQDIFSKLIHRKHSSYKLFILHISSVVGMQGCALAEPGGLWHITFALGRLENLRFFIQIICWAPWILQVQSTGRPSIFLRAQPWVWYSFYREKKRPEMQIIRITYI